MGLMFEINPSTKNDCKIILEYIKKLALFEKAADEVSLSLEELENDGFGENPLFQSFIMKYNNQLCGFALIYNRYSTWKGKSLYIEDIYVDEEFRGNGIGLKTFQYISKIAIETHCKRMEWQVLDWNEPAINFYKKINASLDNEWVNCKIESKAVLKNLIEM